MLPSSSKRKEVQTISKRVQVTKQEVEQLKAELTELINAGVGSANSKESVNQKRTENEEIKPKRQIQLQTRSKEHSQSTEIPSKRNRDYNVEEARDYMKKQREKRIEMLKSQIRVQENRNDLKKQKLNELHQKSRLLVSKNVQMKRERSKSKDNPGQVRPDRAIRGTEELLGNKPDRSRSRERLKSGNEIKKMSACLQVPELQNGVGKTNSAPEKNSKKKNQIENASSKPDLPVAVSKCPKKRSIFNLGSTDVKKSPEMSKNSNLKIPESKSASSVNDTPVEASSLKSVENRNIPAKKQNFLHPSSAINNIYIAPDGNSTKKEDIPNIDLERTIFPPFKNITLRKSEDVVIMTDTCLKQTKETQTQEKNWLDVPELPISAYPYNFINTVKRKLDLTLNTPTKKIDIGVQNSIFSSSKKTERPNLNLKNIENLGLITNGGMVSKKLFETEHSESDTSKNIPDISSESGTSLKKTITKVNLNMSDLKLDTSNLKHLNLQQKSLKTSLNGNSKSTISTEVRTYSADFHTKSDNIINSNSAIVNSKPQTYLKGTYNKNKSKSDFLESKSGSTKSQSNSVISDYAESHFESEKDNNQSEISERIERLLKMPHFKKSSENLAISINGKNESNISDSKKSKISLKLFKNELKTPTSSNLEISEIESVSQIPEEVSIKSRSVDFLTKSNSTKPIEKIILKSGEKTCLDTMNQASQIHLKFEAEVRLLDDFGKTFKNLQAVEESFENLKNKSNTKILHNIDTQTSIVTKTTSTETKIFDNTIPNTINLSRGSDFIGENLLDDTKSINDTFISTGLELSDYNKTILTNEDESFMELENMKLTHCTGLSLNMFEQMIKDEDIRLENLKAIIKIRERALLDRTKGELTWLEIQRKQLIETGKIEEASLVKKKQRGILLKHEQERNEMKKLKQSQKLASFERKNLLRQQRNLIKSQLSTKHMLSTKMKVQIPKERRHSGPLRVLQNCTTTESVRSETSISTRRNNVEEILSVTSSQQSIVSRVSEEEEANVFSGDDKDPEKEPVPVSNLRRSLFMKKQALIKRRKTAEELLQWHQKLLQEEKKILELEKIASQISVIIPSDVEKHTFSGKQLNKLWTNMTGRNDKKFVENQDYVMSQLKLERFCKSARQLTSSSSNNKKSSSEISKSDLTNSEISDVIEELPSKHSIISDCANTEIKSDDYTQDFELVTNLEEEKLSSLSKLIDNFSKIENEISALSRKTEESKNIDKTEDIETDPIENNSSQITDFTLKELSTNKNNLNETYVIKEEISEKLEVPEICEESTEVEINIKSKKFKETSKEITEQLEKLSKKFEKIGEKSEEIEIEELNKLGEKSEEITNKSECSEISEETIETSEIGEKLEEISKKSEELGENLMEISKKLEEINEKSEDARQIVSSKNSEESEIENVQESSKLGESTKSDDSYETMEILTVSNSKEDTSPEKSDETTSSSNKLNIKKRLSEIMADFSSRNDEKSPRLQDLYVTAYDVQSVNSPDSESPELSSSIFGNEAEELLKKQLAIEQEIKQLEQQQKEQLPYVFMREIPNKPPPPYTPPTAAISIIPSDPKEINDIANYSSKILYKAHLSNNLDKAKFSENSFKLLSNLKMSKRSCEFLFNICRELAKEHYKQFEIVDGPSWLILNRRPQLTSVKAFDMNGLEKFLNRKLKELFGFRKVELSENAIIKWSRKRPDHVDEILVLESQEEESQWTNFDQDELYVKDQLTNNLMKMLIEETALVIGNIINKRAFPQ